MYCRNKQPVQKRYVGLDYGEKTIGVSISSPSGKVAVGITTLTRENATTLRPSLQSLKNIIREHSITNMVLGYPKYLDGGNSPRCAETLAFKEKLNRYFKSIPVELWDERLSTRAVSRTFEGKYSQYKQHVDEMAAVYILQGFLDKKNNMKENLDMEQDTKLQIDGDDATITLYDEEGNEVEMQILASRTDGDATYVLVVEEDDEDSEVLHFKLIEEGNDEDTIFEMVDEEHEDFERVFELFKEDYKTLGIDITEIELDN